MSETTNADHRASDLMVRAEQVHKWFGPAHVLKGIDIEVRRREVMCVVGPSGSGKSTFLRCINHLERVDAGRLSVDGELVGYRERGGKLHEMREKEVAAQRRDIGMVFQRFNLFPHLTALENVMEAPCRVKKEPKDVVRDRAQRLLERVGLGDRGGAYPSQLSGGQQQRVPSPGRSPCSPSSCSSTSRRPPSTPSSSARCSTSCAASPRRA